MSSASIVYYIDDEATDAEDKINRLNDLSSGLLHTKYLRPSKSLDLSAVLEGVELFFVDWQLNQRQDNGDQVDYKGGTFAARLREAFPNVPIVLIAREGILDERSQTEFINSLIFDDFISKREIGVHPERVIERALRLITGFSALRDAEKTWLGLLSALKAKPEEEEDIGEASPPLFKSDENDPRSTSWRVPEIAKWIQRTLLRYPGILYDALHAATYLGIAEEEFLRADIQELFNEARYLGVLAPLGGHWWRDRLRMIAHQLISQAELPGSSVNQEFALAFQIVNSEALRLSECIVSKKKPADWVCYILRQPVLIDYSLLYIPDSRPAIMDDARVSFKAIRESPEVFDEYFDTSSRHLLPEIRGWESHEVE